jgi:hypothetical protein
MHSTCIHLEHLALAELEPGQQRFLGYMLNDLPGSVGMSTAIRPVADFRFSSRDCSRCYVANGINRSEAAGEGNSEEQVVVKC